MRSGGGYKVRLRAGPGLELGLGNGHEVRVNWEGKITIEGLCAWCAPSAGCRRCETMRCNEVYVQARLRITCACADRTSAPETSVTRLA